MRKQHRCKALLGVLALSAGLLAVNPTPASAWSRWDAPPTAENLEALRWCESTNDYTADTGNGYYGGVQFSASTWRAVGGSGLPHQHSREEQIAVAECKRLNIPIVSLVDTNCDPDPISYPIPSNDDAIRAIKLILGTMADAAIEGRAAREAGAGAGMSVDDMTRQAAEAEEGLASGSFSASPDQAAAADDGATSVTRISAAAHVRAASRPAEPLRRGPNVSVITASDRAAIVTIGGMTGNSPRCTLCANSRSR